MDSSTAVSRSSTRRSSARHFARSGGLLCAAIVGFAFTTMSLRAQSTDKPAPEPVVWALENVSNVGGHETKLLGSPRVAGEGAERAICFNGKSDGIFVPVNPIAGWQKFTVEVLIKPDGTGPEEQRFFHIQDSRQSRLLIETRVTRDGKWALDTFLYTSDTTRLALLDRTKAHPTDQWYWVALVFDGATMSHYVNGVKELEGAVAFQPMVEGRTSIGVRQNRVYWYKGCIREARFTPRALTAAELENALPK